MKTLIILLITQIYSNERITLEPHPDCVNNINIVYHTSTGIGCVGSYDVFKDQIFKNGFES